MWRWYEANCADWDFGAVAGFSFAVAVCVGFGWYGGVCDPVETSWVVFVEFVLKWDVLLFHVDFFANDHGVDEGFGDGSCWVGFVDGIVVGLVGWRSFGIVVLESLAQRTDAIDELGLTHDVDVVLV